MGRPWSPPRNANRDVWATVGIHPHEADAHADLGRSCAAGSGRHPACDRARRNAGSITIYDKSDRAVQRDLLPHAHHRSARETGLPLVIHTRDAEDDTAEILADEMGKGAYPALIHCFTALARLRSEPRWNWG